jgi:tetratricopeptide (TPR) repeat protein
MDFTDTTVAVIGRLGSVPRWRVAGELARRGGTLTHRLGEADGLVVGYGAHGRFARLLTVLAEAQRSGLWCRSERQFLRALGLVEEAAPLGIHPLDAEGIARHSGLDLSAVRLLALFDIIDDRGGAFEFRDLVAARQVRRLCQGGAALADVIGAILAIRRPGVRDDLLARARLTLLADGELARAVGGYLAELNGQLRLPLDDAGNPSLDALYERAALAEEEGRWMEAEALYRRVIAISPRDGVARFNLAVVLGALQQPAEAERCLEHAVALDPGFAEAWYNLAHAAEARGDSAAARRALERAVDADGRFADALYNLARLCLAAGEPQRAASLYERYLLLDPASPWAERARRALRLCRMARQPDAGAPL